MSYLLVTVTLQENIVQGSVQQLNVRWGKQRLQGEPIGTTFFGHTLLQVLSMLKLLSTSMHSSHRCCIFWFPSCINFQCKVKNLYMYFTHFFFLQNISPPGKIKNKQTKKEQITMSETLIHGLIYFLPSLPFLSLLECGKIASFRRSRFHANLSYKV